MMDAQVKSTVTKLKNCLTRFVPVREKGSEAFVGERMFGKCSKYRRRYGRDIGTCHRCEFDVERRAN